jgi:hypothetical protein
MIRDAAQRRHADRFMVDNPRPEINSKAPGERRCDGM